MCLVSHCPSRLRSWQTIYLGMNAKAILPEVYSSAVVTLVECESMARHANKKQARHGMARPENNEFRMNAVKPRKTQ